jgi:uncharacterized protein (UPF0261 family)
LRLVAKTVAKKLNKAKGPVKFIIPEKGWSTLSVEGQPLYDPDDDKVLVDELKKHLKPEIEVRKLELHLNTPEFAMVLVETFDGMMKRNDLNGNIFD